MDNRSFILEVLNSQEKYKDTEVTREEAKQKKNVITKNEGGCTKYFYIEYESVDSDGFDKLCVREIAKRAILYEEHQRIIEERQRVMEERQRAMEEHQRMAEEHQYVIKEHLRIIKGILIAGVVYIVIKEILSLLIFLS